MLRKKKLVVAICLLLAATAGIARAQGQRPAPTRNAALRYWLAFAELHDPPADKATADLLEKTAAREAPWNEAKLGAILDKNQEAILAMQRATKLPECDWGLDYELGANASIAYVPRARVLARLNTLYGMRMAAKGETQRAADTWLAGIRFSQHLAQGGSLIFALVGKTVLLSNFQALTQAAENGKLADVQKKQVAAVVQTLPETGFDWSAALLYEQAGLDVAAKELTQAANPRQYYEDVTGQPAPGILDMPDASDVAAFHNLMGAAENALRLPPEQAQQRLMALQESVKTLRPFYRQTTPSFTRINDARVEVQLARTTLLRALGH